MRGYSVAALSLPFSRQRRRDHRSDLFLCEVSMLGRRSHARVSIESGAEGVLSLTRDISVRVNGDRASLSRSAAMQVR